ncbi:MAG: DUF2147 domain-containing protein [Aestuariivirga sp.]
MMIYKILKAVFAAATLLAVSMPAQAADSAAFGDWALSTGQLVVRAAPCGGNNVCANVIWLPEPNNADGTPKLDLKNPTQSLKSRHLIGMPVLEGMVPAGNNTWRGRVYSSDDGAYYRATATVNGDKLHVKGCWVVFCKDLYFSRKK